MRRLADSPPPLPPDSGAPDLLCTAAPGFLYSGRIVLESDQSHQAGLAPHLSPAHGPVGMIQPRLLGSGAEP